MLWSAENGEARHTLEGHRDRAYSVAYRADGTLLATSAGDGTVRTWDADGGRPLQEFAGPRDISCVAWRPDDDELAAASAEGNVMLYNLGEATSARIVWTREPNPVEVSIAGVRR